MQITFYNPWLQDVRSLTKGWNLTLDNTVPIHDDSSNDYSCTVIVCITSQRNFKLLKKKWLFKTLKNPFCKQFWNDARNGKNIKSNAYPLGVPRVIVHYLYKIAIRQNPVAYLRTITKAPCESKTLNFKLFCLLGSQSTRPQLIEITRYELISPQLFLIK